MEELLNVNNKQFKIDDEMIIRDTTDNRAVSFKHSKADVFDSIKNLNENEGVTVIYDYYKDVKPFTFEFNYIALDLGFDKPVDFDNVWGILNNEIPQDHGYMVIKRSDRLFNIIFKLDRNIVQKADPHNVGIRHQLLDYFTDIINKALEDNDLDSKFRIRQHFNEDYAISQFLDDERNSGIFPIKSMDLKQINFLQSVRYDYIHGFMDKSQYDRLVEKLNSQGVNSPDGKTKMLFKVGELLDQRFKEVDKARDGWKPKHSFSSFVITTKKDQHKVRYLLSNEKPDTINYVADKSNIKQADSRPWYFDSFKLMNLLNKSSDVKPLANELRVTGKGTIVPSMYNVVQLIENMVQGSIRQDSFSHKTYLVKDIEVNGTKIKKGEIDQSRLEPLMFQLSSIMTKQPSEKLILRAIDYLSNVHAMNRVYDYMMSLPRWDGTKRVETLFSDWIGADKSSFTKWASLSFMMSSMQLILQPGSSVQLAFDLIGDGGTGKTTLVRKLFNNQGAMAGRESVWNRDVTGWYTDQISSFNSKDDKMRMGGRLVVNDDEFVVSRKTSVPDLKKFATLQNLEVRKPYDSTDTNVLRTFLLVRTSNSVHDLYRSVRGNRRFVPIISKKSRLKEGFNVVDDLTPEIVDQIWSETKVLYLKHLKRGDLGTLVAATKSKEDEIESRSNMLRYTDESKVAITCEVQDRVHDTPSFATDPTSIIISSDDVLQLTSDYLGTGKRATNRISTIMQDELGFRRCQTMVSGSRVTGWRSTEETPRKLKEALKAIDYNDQD